MAEHGTLLVRVYTSRAQLPVEGAAVAVTRGGKTLLALRETDENGRIPPLTLPAPPRRDSLNPGQSHPFSLYDIWVEHPEFELVHIEQVQLFPGVTTEQNIELLPRSILPAKTIQTTPQPL